MKNISLFGSVDSARFIKDFETHGCYISSSPENTITDTSRQARKNLEKTIHERANDHSDDLEIKDKPFKINSENGQYGLGSIVRKMLRNDGRGRYFSYGLNVEYRGGKEFIKKMKKKNKAAETTYATFCSKMATANHIEPGWLVKMEGNTVVVAENGEALNPKQENKKETTNQLNAIPVNITHINSQMAKYDLKLEKPSSADIINDPNLSNKYYILDTFDVHLPINLGLFYQLSDGQLKIDGVRITNNKIETNYSQSTSIVRAIPDHKAARAISIFIEDNRLFINPHPIKNKEHITT